LNNRFRGQNNLKIHLGCGPRSVSGWVNVDATNQEGVDLQWDLRSALPFDNCSTEMIYSEHVLEHLHKPDALKLLGECYRILKPGGLMRIGVPDAELYLRAYVEDDGSFFKKLERLGGSTIPLSTPIDVINQMFRMGGSHLFAWDFHTLSLDLQSTGFIALTRWASGEASRPEICLDDPAHAFETVYVEAAKPEA